MKKTRWCGQKDSYMRKDLSLWDKYAEIASKFARICPFVRMHFDWSDVNIPVGYSSRKSHLWLVEKLVANEWRIDSQCELMRNGRAVLGEPKTKLWPNREQRSDGWRGYWLCQWHRNPLCSSPLSPYEPKVVSRYAVFWRNMYTFRDNCSRKLAGMIDKKRDRLRTRCVQIGTNFVRKIDGTA